MLRERLSVNVQKKLRKEEEEEVLEILNFINSLKNNPIKKNSLRCKEPGFSESIFTISYLDYRILYEVNFKENIILIQDITKEKMNFISN